MRPVLAPIKWRAWCRDKGLDPKGARFAASTCYYGTSSRSRVGTLLLSESELVHWSYARRDTWWAVFEPSVPVRVPLADVVGVRRRPMPLRFRLVHGFPAAHFVVCTYDHARHDLLVHGETQGARFAAAIEALGVPLVEG